MDPGNGEEAVREALLDVQEGADMGMVKPAPGYGHVIGAVQSATAAPLAPYNRSGREPVGEAEVMQRTQRLLDERIIRQVTPIFDTRALGYSSMLVAAKVDPEYPHRAAKVINAHPGVSHNYLRNHDFNLWFTIATEPDSKLGLEGTLEVLAREAGAEAMRQLPTLDRKSVVEGKSVDLGGRRIIKKK